MNAPKAHPFAARRAGMQPARPRAALPAGLRIRLMEAADLASYKVLRDMNLAKHPEAFTSDAETELRRPPETYLARVAGAADGGWPFTLTAWQGDQLCGAISCERDERAKVRHIGHVVGMIVHESVRGRGIGLALAEGCVTLARGRQGIEMLTLSVTSGNTAAIRLYERVGFMRYGLLEHALRVGERYHDKELMVLRLEPEDSPS